MLLQHTRKEVGCLDFPPTYLHILVPTFTGNSNLNFEILSEPTRNHTHESPKYSLGLSPRDLRFSLSTIHSLKLITKLLHHSVFVKSPLVHALGDALICSVASFHIDKSNISTRFLCAIYKVFAVKTSPTTTKNSTYSDLIIRSISQKICQFWTPESVQALNHRRHTSNPLLGGSTTCSHGSDQSSRRYGCSAGSTGRAARNIGR